MNDKVEELRLGLEEEEEQSHDDDDGISSAVARAMCSKTYAEKKIASHTGFKAPNDEEDYDQRTTPQTLASLKDSLVKKKRQGGIYRGTFKLIPLSTAAAATTTILLLSEVQKLALTSQSPLHF